MSYQGLSRPLVSYFLSQLYRPTVLEIGVDKGQTAIPLIHNLVLDNIPFKYEGVDIMIQDSVMQCLSNMRGVKLSNIDDNPNVNIIFGNSLSILPQLIDGNFKYDLILLDGDHNYYTVSRELEMIKHLCHTTTIIICDDYNGRWSHQDLYYCDKDEYKDVKISTHKQNTKKKGVKPAIDDFIDNEKGKWSLIDMVKDNGSPGEFCILHKKEFIDIHFSNEQKYMFQTKLNLIVNENHSHRFINSPMATT